MPSGCGIKGHQDHPNGSDWEANDIICSSLPAHVQKRQNGKRDKKGKMGKGKGRRKYLEWQQQVEPSSWRVDGKIGLQACGI